MQTYSAGTVCKNDPIMFRATFGLTCGAIEYCTPDGEWRYSPFNVVQCKTPRQAAIALNYWLAGKGKAAWEPGKTRNVALFRLY